MPIIWELKYYCSLLISAFICPLKHVEGTSVEIAY